MIRTQIRHLFCAADVTLLAYCLLWKSRLFLLGLMTSSVFNVTALTVERYLEIIHPLRHKAGISRAKVIHILKLKVTHILSRKVTHILSLEVTHILSFKVTHILTRKMTHILSLSDLLHAYRSKTLTKTHAKHLHNTCISLPIFCNCHVS